MFFLFWMQEALSSISWLTKKKTATFSVNYVHKKALILL